ncbi:MAG: hypothetical protein HYU64_01780 [Armatimonadetes bacterium]|nr:hypothetical protein [Armatimonadota bacterium]
MDGITEARMGQVQTEVQMYALQAALAAQNTILNVINETLVDALRIQQMNRDGVANIVNASA